MTRKGILGLLCAGACVGLLVAGLSPFRFHPRNQVTWLAGQNGIRFGRSGIAYGEDPVYGAIGSLRPGRPLSVELVVRPAREVHHALARILTLDDGKKRQYFTFAQWKSNLILRAASRGNDLRRDFREMGTMGVLRENVPVFLAITSSNGTTMVYADGQLRNVRKDFNLLPTGPLNAGRIVLGISPSGTASWAGDLLFLAAYDRELAADEVLRHFRDWRTRGTPTWLPGQTPAILYAFDEGAGTIARDQGRDHHDITVPATFHALHKDFLRPPWREERYDSAFLKDVAVNILGFSPFGFLVAAWLRNDGSSPGKFDVFAAGALGGGLSLAIEILQFYLPARTSSLTDVVSNLLGALLGAYLFSRHGHRFRKAW